MAGLSSAPALDHVTLAASDLARAVAFYDAALAPLGLQRLGELVDEEEDDAAVEAAGWGRPEERPVLWVVIASQPTRGVHVSLRAGSREDVQAFHAAALATGGTEHSAPRRWPLYRRGEFNAIVADPDGNLVEAVAPE